MFLFVPLRELTYPIMGKRKSSSKAPLKGDMLVPRVVVTSKDHLIKSADESAFLFTSNCWFEVDSFTWGGSFCVWVLKKKMMMMMMTMTTSNTISLSHEVFARINLGIPQPWITMVHVSVSAPAAFHFFERLCGQWREKRGWTLC